MDEQKDSAQGDPQAAWGAPGQAPPRWESTSGSAAAGGQNWGSPPPPPSFGPAGQQTEGLAIGALICAIANWVFWFFIPAIVALILASVAARRIRQSNGAVGGRGLVIAARIVAIIGLVVNTIAAVGLTYVIVEAARDADAAVQDGAAPGDTSVFLLQPGECMVGSTDGLVTDVNVVPCDQPHDAEVIVNFDLPDGPFPGDENVTLEAESQCLVHFESFVGIPFEESQYDLRFFRPNEDSWARSDRSVTCMVAPLGPEQLVGSAQGTNQ
jgi:Septum formation